MNRQNLDYDVLEKICDRAFFLALEMIHQANHRPYPDKGEPKVGGHASACSSSQHILSAIHLVHRNPEDYLACKPHVSPMDHALNFLLHNFRDTLGNRFSDEARKKVMSHLRHFSKEGDPVFQSYHAEADPDGYRFFPSGSVGIPPVTALYTALAYEYAKDHGYDLKEEPFFWCLMGDSEFREGSLAEAMPDAGERELNRVVWIVDYNRQNLDGTRISNEKALEGSDADRMMRIARANGWHAIELKHGSKRQALFDSKGGDIFKEVLNEKISDFEMQALIEANRPELTVERLAKKSEKLAAWLKTQSAEKIHEAFLNLGGHDMRCLVEAMDEARKSSKPTFIVAYTIKGRGLQCQAKSGNHSTLPEVEELQTIGAKLGLSHEDPFQDFESGSVEENYLTQRRAKLLDGIDQVLNNANERRENWKQKVAAVDWPVDFNITALKFNPVAHTQWMWGQIAAKLDRLARGENAKDPQGDEAKWDKVSEMFLTMAPDVGTSTNTSPNMNGKLYGDIEDEDYQQMFDTKDKKAPDIVPKSSKRTGHLRFEIAEGNCMSAAGAFGKFGYYVGIPFFPAMTIYDFFIKRAHDQFYYNLYWKASFATIGTPSGITLAPEGAQHSWKSDFQIPHCVTWEPSYAKELEWILADTLRLHFGGESEGRESVLIRCVTKGLVQKEFLSRLKQQTRFKNSNADDVTVLETVRKEVLLGGYPLIHFEGYEDYVPGDNVVHLFSMGALTAEAIKASDALKEKGIYANVFVVTSSDLLLGNFAYQNQFDHLTNGLGVTGNLYVTKESPHTPMPIQKTSDWYAIQANRIPIVSVHDGEPGLLDNIGSIVGVKHHALAVRKTSKSGTTRDIFAYHHLDADGIVEAAESVLTQTADEHFRVNADLFQNLLKGSSSAY